MLEGLRWNVLDPVVRGVQDNEATQIGRKLVRYQVWSITKFYHVCSLLHCVCLPGEGKSMSQGGSILFSFVPSSNSLVLVSDPLKSF